jgi:hypothetical protein
MWDRGDRGLSRRGLLAGLAGAGAWSIAGAAAAGPDDKDNDEKGEPAGSVVQDIEAGKRGTTITLALAHGMFPAPGAPWKDPTTRVFVPSHFRVLEDQRVDAVVHFHGHKTTALAAMKKHQLREQLDDSRQNAILIMPQGPVNAVDSSGGKLDRAGGLARFLAEVRTSLQRPEVGKALGAAHLPGGARIGMVCASAHSGGFGVTARCLKHGGHDISEVYLFDALYGEVAAYLEWVLERRDRSGARERHKLVSYYAGGKPKTNSLALIESLRARGVGVLHEEREGQLSRAELTRARAVFIRTAIDHSRLTYQSNALRDCLFASGLHRRLESDWFRAKDGERAIDRRK